MDLTNPASKIDAPSLLLVCPLCHDPLQIQDRSARCPQGHSYDLSRSGTLNFISRRLEPRADEAFESDRALHELEPWELLHREVSHLLPESGHRVFTGSGLGPFLSPGDLGFEAHARGVELQRRRDPALALHAALASRLPLGDATIGALIRLDDQADTAESWRILRPGGTLLRVLAARDHQLEIRRHLFTGRRLGQREKPELIRSLASLGDPQHRRFARTLSPTREQWIILLSQWGPLPPEMSEKIMDLVPQATFAWDLWSVVKP